MTSPGLDTNPSQVSSQQTLVLIYLPRKDGKLTWLRRKRRSRKYSNLGKAGYRSGDLVVERQRSYQVTSKLKLKHLVLKLKKVETINHIISECKMLANKGYKSRHDNIARLVHWKLCCKYEKWFEHQPEGLVERKM